MYIFAIVYLVVAAFSALLAQSVERFVIIVMLLQTSERTAYKAINKVSIYYANSDCSGSLFVVSKGGKLEARNIANKFVWM